MYLASLTRRLATLALTLVAAVGLGTAVGIVSSASDPQPALAYNPGGKITVKTVMARAKWWMNTYGVIYSQNQNDAKSDGTGEKYRPDCSGFVSMAWHLQRLNTGSDLWTGAFNNPSAYYFANGTRVSNVISHVSLSNLKRGDAVLRHDSTQQHIMLFDKWANTSKTEMYVYEEYDWGKAGRYVKIAKPSSAWKGVRYSKIVSETSLTTTKWCEYKVTSGTIRKRSGPGTSYTGEGNLSSGATFMASTATYSAGGKTWRRMMDGRLWVASGDSGYFSRTTGSCLS